MARLQRRTHGGQLTPRTSGERDAEMRRKRRGCTLPAFHHSCMEKRLNELGGESTAAGRGFARHRLHQHCPGQIAVAAGIELLDRMGTMTRVSCAPKGKRTTGRETPARVSATSEFPQPFPMLPPSNLVGLPPSPQQRPVGVAENAGLRGAPERLPGGPSISLGRAI
jgi:hypothetical protein